MRCLIVYSSKYGQTEKIADRIADTMRSASADVEVQSAERPIQRSDLEQCDVVVFGSPVYFARHSKLIGRNVKEHLAILNQKFSGFYSVSLSASGNEKQRDDANRCVDAFLGETGWTPTARAIFAGKLAYREYGWITRMLMKWISWREGGDFDTSRNHEYTDWNAVDAFALDLLAIASTDKSGQDETHAVNTATNEQVRVVDH